MFLSKIWFFLIAVAAAAAMTVALVLPKPAERKAKADEERRLADACAVTNILLTENARVRIDLAGDFSRFPSVTKVLDAASRADRISPDLNKTARDAADELLGSVTGSIKPAFVLMIDARGRVVARAGKAVDTTRYGDTMAGYYLVDDALSGYLRDDLWQFNQSLFRVAASPVVHRDPGARDRYAGAVVLGHPIDKDLVDTLREQVRFDVSFYVGGSPVANSSTAQLHKDILQQFDKVKDAPRERVTDCAENKPFTVHSGSDEYAAVVARLPGEAAKEGAFYAVFSKRPKTIGFFGTLGAVDGHDLAFGNFPWIHLGIALVLVLGIGIFLMLWEADWPLKKLAADAVALAKGDKQRLEEDRHGGKFGSIARSVNIQLDKQEREAKSAKKDLDQLLGPAPEDSMAGAPSPLPAVGPGGGMGNAFSPPPPSDFRFSDGGGGGGASASASAGAAAAAPAFDLDLPPPPPAPSSTPPPRSMQNATDARVPPKPVTLPGGKPPAPPAMPPKRPATPPPLAPAALGPFDDDILGDVEPQEDALPAVPGRAPSDFDAPTRVADPSRSLLEQSAAADNDAAFRKVYDEFLALKKKCGESVANLTFDKFSAKLLKNRQALMTKHGCREVRFQVYVKDGRAALKATPVKG